MYITFSKFLFSTITTMQMHIYFESLLYYRTFYFFRVFLLFTTKIHFSILDIVQINPFNIYSFREFIWSIFFSFCIYLQLNPLFLWEGIYITGSYFIQNILFVNNILNFHTIIVFTVSRNLPRRFFIEFQ